MIFGCGTGRCGTSSLAALLNAQDGIQVTHELGHRGMWLPWEPNWSRQKEARRWLCEQKLDGDVAHFWLRYLPTMLEFEESFRAIVLRRGLQETMDSFFRYAGNKNQFSKQLTGVERRNARAECFPKYNLPRPAAFVSYWNEYYARATMIARRFPEQVRIVDMNSALNEERTQEEMLRFVGIEEPKLRLGLCLNASPKEVA